jgi:hypothetical protein
VSQGGGARQEGYVSLAERDYVGAQASFEKAIAFSTDADARAEGYMGLGKVHLEQGRTAEAIQAFYEAAKLPTSAEVTCRVNRALGTAYFEMGHYALAQRYLHKGLKNSQGRERQEALARLVVSARALNNTREASRYRAHLSKPYSREVRTLLSTPPKQHEESCRYCAGTIHATAQDPIAEMPANEAPPPPAGPNRRLQVLPRGEWNARSIKSNVKLMGPIDKITIHHTAGPTFWDSTRSGAAEQIRNIQRFHQKQRGWADIGYHYVIDRAGNVWQGRSLRYQGAHAQGHLNHGNVGIAVLGNFCEQRPTRAQYVSLAIMVEKLCAHFQLGSDRVFTHGELTNGHTRCPGPALSRCVVAIRRDLNRRLVAYRTSGATTR